MPSYRNSYSDIGSILNEQLLSPKSEAQYLASPAHEHRTSNIYISTWLLPVKQVAKYHQRFKENL